MAEPISGTTDITADGGSFCMRVWEHGAMGGPPLHVHHADDEAWHVLDGCLRFRFANVTQEVPAGGTMFVPAGVAHTFSAPGAVRYLIVSTQRVFDLIAALHDESDARSHDEIYRAHDAELLE